MLSESDNPFLRIKKEAKEAQNQRPAGSPAVMSTNNVKKPTVALAAMAQKKPPKKDYMFYLYPEDRALIDDLAVSAGYFTKGGRPNALAFIAAMAHVLKENHQN